MRMRLFPHQKEVLQQTKDLNRVGYYLDMGLGKTFVGSEKMKQLGNKKNLLICQKSKIKDWSHHFFDYYPDYTVFELSDSNKIINMFLDFNGNKIGIINYDLIFRRPNLLELEGFTLMLDESSMIQNETAKRSKFVLKMNPENVILLSGTPTSGKYENLWSQVHLLGWNIGKNLYNRQYVNWKTLNVGGFPIKTVDKENPYKNVDRLKQKLRDHGAVFMKTEEVMDLPKQNFITVNVPATIQYKKFQRNSIVTVGGLELIGDTTLTKRLYSRILCGQYNEYKLDTFADLVASTQDRLIVFYNFNAELELLKEIIDRPISEINGTTKDLTNYEQEENSITLVQYQAGAMGLNLQRANKIIYFTLTEKSELFEQSKKRIHRIGQEKPCFYYTLICKGSIEEDILKNLEMRRDYTDDLFKEYEANN